jgi:hypothetical protein
MKRPAKDPEYRTCRLDGCWLPTKTVYCCQEHAKLDQRIVDRPTQEELEMLVWTHPTRELAKIFGVTDTTIANWCRQMGIDKPPRGYWTGRQRKQIVTR